jgi:HEPN domain-containing protein
MPHDPVRISETRSWLLKAQQDLRAAEHSLKANPPLLSTMLFHCQQVAEKALKAFLTWHDEKFRKTHSIEEIGEQCCKLDKSLTNLIDEAVLLTPYSWKFRYPGEDEEPTSNEAKTALLTAKKVYTAIIDRLPKESQT